MLRVEKLGKRYRSGTWGLRGFQMVSGPGVTAIVGPPGSGKSTLLRMLATVTPPTEGSIAWGGVDVTQRPIPYRRSLGYLPERLGTYDGISGRVFMRYIAALKGLGSEQAAARVDEVIDLFNLGSFADEKMGGYLHAICRRLGLAQALLNDPAVLLVDSGGGSLDEKERAALCALIGQVAAGRTAVVATEHADDVAGIAARVGLLNNGHLVPLDTESAGSEPGYHTVDELVQSVSGLVWLVTVDQNVYVELRRSYVLSDVSRGEDGLDLRILAEMRPHPEAIQAAPTLADACTYHIHRDAVRRGHDVRANAGRSVDREVT
jgi:ABC-type multidrug transport system ATPase subunit